jgi:hypothetical protein
MGRAALSKTSLPGLPINALNLHHPHALTRSPALPPPFAAGVVFLLVSRGACLHAALYGAVLGSQEALIKVLLEAGADPAWDEGSAISAAVATGREALVNLLLPA